jgi:hypothetical protein
MTDDIDYYINLSYPLSGLIDFPQVIIPSHYLIIKIEIFQYFSKQYNHNGALNEVTQLQIIKLSKWLQSTEQMTAL